MPNVQMPDGTVVAMPDNPTADQIAKLRAVTAAAKSQPLPQAAPQQATAPADSGGISSYLPDWMKNIGTAAYKGIGHLATNAADVFANQPDAATALASLGGGQAKADFDKLYNGMSSGQVQTPVTNALDSTGYQPKTASEKVINSLVQAGAGAALAPGSTVKNVIAGVAGAGAGDLAKHYTDNKYIQVAATLAGGVGGYTLASLAKLPWQNAETILTKALPGITPDDLTTAKQVMQDAASGKTPINLNVAQALQKPTGLDEVVNALANNKNGVKTAELLRNQPAQVAAAAPAAVEALPGTVTNAADAANAVQGAAGKFMTNTRDFRTQASSPYWEAQQQADLGAVQTGAQLQDVKEQIAKAMATQQSAAQAGGKLTALANQQAETNFYLNRHSGGIGEAGTPPAVVSGAAEGAQEAQQVARTAAQKADSLKTVAQQLADSPQLASQQAVRGRVADLVGQIEQKMQIAGPEEASVLQDLKDQLAPKGQPLQFPSQVESVRKSISAPLTATSSQAERTAAGVIGPYAKQLNEIVDMTSPSIQQGRKVYQQVTQDVVTPAKQSVTGVIAGPKGVPLDTQATASRLATVFNKGTNPTGTSQIMKLGDDLRTVDGGAEAFNNAAVTHLSDKVQGAIDSQGPAVGGQAAVGPKTAANMQEALYGTPVKAQGTREILVQLARNKGLPDNSLYPAFDKVMSYVSAAAKQPNTVQGTNVGEIAKEAAAAHGAQILTPFSSGKQAVGNFFSGGAYKQIDNMLNTPEGVDKLIQLSKTLNQTTGPKTNAAIATFLGSLTDQSLTPAQSGNEQKK